jgi:hypothetical protein
MIPFGIFAPDLGRFQSGTSPNVVNAQPVGATGWGPMPQIVEVSEALPDEPKGAIAVRSSTGTYAIYAFTSTNCYKLDGSDYSWDSVGSGLNLAQGDLWSLNQYGKYLVATNINDAPQYLDVDAAGMLGAIPGSPPNAKYNWVVGEHLALGNHATFPNRVMISARGNIAEWEVGQNGCDYQDLPDGEDVMGGIGSQTGAMIFQKKAIRQMVLGAVGDYAFRLEVMHANRGVIAPYSIVPIGPSSAAYLSSDGFAMDMGTQIGEGFVDRYFFESADADSLALTKGVVDPYAHIIWWQVTLTTGRKLLGYHYGLKRWCLADNDVSFFVDLATPAITIDGLALLYGSMDEIAEPFDSRLFSGGLPAFAAFTTDYILGFFTGGTPKAATFDTWEMPLAPGRRAFLQEARVVTDATTHTLKVAPADRFSGTEPTFGSAVSPNSTTGICHFRSDGYMHKFRAEIAAGEDWSHVMGLEDIRAVPSGRR